MIGDIMSRLPRALNPMLDDERHFLGRRLRELERTTHRQGFYSFLSYSTRDDEIATIKPFLHEYVTALRSLGISYIPIFCDAFYIPEGHPHLHLYLKEQLYRSDFTTAFLSPGYVSSSWCAFEWWESESLSELTTSHEKPVKHAILPICWKAYADRARGIFSCRGAIDISQEMNDQRWQAALEIAVRQTVKFLEWMYDPARSADR
jgi:hypothetical protein